MDNDEVEPPTTDPDLFVSLDAPEPTDGDDPADPSVNAPAQGAPPRRRGLWVLVGAVLVVIGLAAGATALYSHLTDEPSTERRAGRLIETTDAGAAASADGDEPSEDPAVTVASASTDTAPAATPGATEPGWPTWVMGQPRRLFEAEAPPTEIGETPPGFYLWLDFEGWHLWLVGGEGSDASVEIQSDDAFSKAEPVGTPPAIEQEGNRLRMSRGDASATSVGLDFNPGFFAKTLIVTTTGDLPLYAGVSSRSGAPYLGVRYGAEG